MARTPIPDLARSSSSSSIPQLIDGTLEMDDTIESEAQPWSRVRVLVKHGASVVKDLLPVAQSITDKSYDVAKRSTKFGFECADACLDLTSQGMQMIGADSAAGVFSAVAGTVQGISNVTNANLSIQQQIACDSIATVTSSLDLIGVQGGGASKALVHAGLIDLDTIGALFAVFRVVSNFTDIEPIPLLQAPQVCKAAMAVSQLHHLAQQAIPSGNLLYFFEDETPRTKRLRHQIYRYARFALAAFRTETLQFLGVDVPPDADANHTLEEAIALFTGIRARDVKKVEHAQKACQPAYFVALDHEEKQVVVSFRGTLTMHDILTDLVCESVTLEHTAWESGGESYAHKGMWDAASFLSTLLSPLIDQLLTGHPDYGVILCGYSLGAGVATLLTRLWRVQYPTSTAVHCFAFAPPCSMSLDVAATMEPYVTSIIVGDDVVPRLSLSSASNLRDTILAFKDNPELLREITEKANETSDDVKLWAQGVLSDAAANVATRTRFVPAGRILWVANAAPSAGPIEVVETTPDKFGDIVLSRSLIYTHLPASYAKVLRI